VTRSVEVLLDVIQAIARTFNERERKEFVLELNNRICLHCGDTLDHEINEQCYCRRDD